MQTYWKSRNDNQGQEQHHGPQNFLLTSETLLIINLAQNRLIRDLLRTEISLAPNLEVPALLTPLSCIFTSFGDTFAMTLFFLGIFTKRLHVWFSNDSQHWKFAFKQKALWEENSELVKNLPSVSMTLTRMVPYYHNIFKTSKQTDR